MRVGIVGAGQLARMLCEAASALGIHTVLLAEHAADAAVDAASEVLIGVPTSATDMHALAERCDVITFDHEQVDLDLVEAIEATGFPVHPGVHTLKAAVDKSVLHANLFDHGIDVPVFEIVEPSADILERAASFGAGRGRKFVLKTARGGYDGKGVWVLDDPLALSTLLGSRPRATWGTVLIEEFVEFDLELAVLVARRPSGDVVTWPAVETAQIDGVCREVLHPGTLTDNQRAEAEKIACRVAEIVGSTGVLAVEMFLKGDRFMVNEVAARPHNSGHWTIEGTVMSQFEGHFRAVLDLPFGTTRAASPTVATVNIFGDDEGRDPSSGIADAMSIDDARIHLYGKTPRPGRKLGHVTVCGDDPATVRARAWAAARMLGTPVPAGLKITLGQ